ncbi:MAG: hypothetical protein J3K34DRAFT_439349 [Monoraphidium minutum]|nr:MAG: hypothetical protein J3K34DRAFT_439349 [Monoraphidium minutum]
MHTVYDSSHADMNARCDNASSRQVGRRRRCACRRVPGVAGPCATPRRRYARAVGRGAWWVVVGGVCMCIEGVTGPARIQVGDTAVAGRRSEWGAAVGTRAPRWGGAVRNRTGLSAGLGALRAAAGGWRRQGRPLTAASGPAPSPACVPPKKGQRAAARTGAARRCRRVGAGGGADASDGATAAGSEWGPVAPLRGTRVRAPGCSCAVCMSGCLCVSTQLRCHSATFMPGRRPHAGFDAGARVRARAGTRPAPPATPC